MNCIFCNEPADKKRKIINGQGMPICKQCSNGDGVAMAREMQTTDTSISMVRQFNNTLVYGDYVVSDCDYSRIRDYYQIPYKTWFDFDKHCPIGKIYHQESPAGRVCVGAC